MESKGFTTDFGIPFKEENGSKKFAGPGEEGTRDGTALYAQFHEPCGIAVGFNHVGYICDSSSGSIRQITTMMETALSLRTVGKIESLKSLIQWSADYYTSASSWYPLPDDSLELKNSVFPAPLPAISMMPDDKISMREWASVNGQVVRQRTVRQETTMAKAGTIPEAAYRTALATRDIGNLAAETTVLEGRNNIE
eukprot:gene10574-19309_t